MATFVGLTATASEKRTIDLLIADESAMDCQLLKNALSRARSTHRIVGCAVSQADVIHSLHSNPPGIALIGESLQDGPLTGFAVLREIHHSFPKTNVVVLLKSPNTDHVVEAFRAGAKGVFCRAEPVQNLCKCISAVHRGQVWANSCQLRAVLDAFANASPLNLANSHGRPLLTKREVDVVKLVVNGSSNRAVAEMLGITEHTVSNYLFRIYEKLGISTRVELVLYSMRPT